MRLPATGPEPRATSTGENQGVGMRIFHPSSLRWLRGSSVMSGGRRAAQEAFTPALAAGRSQDVLVNFGVYRDRELSVMDCHPAHYEQDELFQAC